MNTRKWDTFQHSLTVLGHLIYAEEMFIEISMQPSFAALI